jgi:hypothetical protein
VLRLSGPKGDLPKENTPASITASQTLRFFAEADNDVVKRSTDADTAEVRPALETISKDVDQATMDVLFAAEKGA